MFSLWGKMNQPLGVHLIIYIWSCKNYDFLKYCVSLFVLKNCDPGVYFEDNIPKHHQNPTNSTKLHNYYF